MARHLPNVHFKPDQRTAYLDEIERAERRARIDAERRAARRRDEAPATRTEPSSGGGQESRNSERADAA